MTKETVSPIDKLPNELILRIGDYLYLPELNHLALVYPCISRSKRYREHKLFSRHVEALSLSGIPLEPHQEPDDYFPTTTEDIQVFALTDDLAYYTSHIDLRPSGVVSYPAFQESWADSLDTSRGDIYESEDFDEKRLCRAAIQARLRIRRHSNHQPSQEFIPWACCASSNSDFTRINPTYSCFPHVACLTLELDDSDLFKEDQLIHGYEESEDERAKMQEVSDKIRHMRWVSRVPQDADYLAGQVLRAMRLRNLHTLELGPIDVTGEEFRIEDQALQQNRSQSLRCIVFRNSEIPISWVYAMARLLVGPCHIFRTSSMANRISNPSWGHIELPCANAPESSWKLELGAYATLPDWALQRLHRGEPQTFTKRQPKPCMQ